MPLRPTGVGVDLELEAPWRAGAVVPRVGRLDVLVNVAGGSGRKWGDGPTDSCTIEGWNKTLALNLDSVFYCCKYALQSMLPRRQGVIVNVSSAVRLDVGLRRGVWGRNVDRRLTGSVKGIFNKINAIREIGITVLLIEQEVNTVFEMADRSYVLSSGKIVAEGTGTDLMANELLRKTYLGL